MFGNGAALASARYMYVVWLAVVRRTTLIGTIFRYSLSWIDGPSLAQETLDPISIENNQILPREVNLNLTSVLCTIQK